MCHRKNVQKTEEIDFTDYKALPVDPVNHFEQKQTDYTKYDELIESSAFQSWNVQS